MRRNLITFLVILVAVYVSLSAVDSRGSYMAEKEFWKINKLYVETTKDLKAVPKATFINLAKDFERYEQKYEKSNLTAMAQTIRGRLYIYAEEYPRARETFKAIVADNTDNSKIAVGAAMEIGESYKQEGKYDEALAAYQDVLDNYPLTKEGMRVPILVTRFFAERGDTENTKIAFDQALKHYKKLITTYPDSRIEAEILSLVAKLLLILDRFEEAVNVYNEILTRFSDPQTIDVKMTDSVIKSINTISIVKLKNLNLPISIYENFIATNPDHPLNDVLEGIVHSYKSLRKNNQAAGGS